MSKITPELDRKIINRSHVIAKEQNLIGSMKEWTKAYHQAIKEAGYSVAYYRKCMKHLAEHNPDNDDNYDWMKD